MARSADLCVLSSSVVVDRAIQECWDLYVNNNLLPQWSPAVTDTECSAKQLNIDVIRKNCVSIDGREGSTIEQCIKFEPLKSIEFSVLEETFGFSHMLNSYGFGVSFDIEDKTTLLVMNTHYTPKKIFALVMSSKATQRQLVQLMSESLEGFKRYAEAL